MTKNFLNSIPLVLKGRTAAIEEAERRLRQYAPEVTRESEATEADGSSLLAYRIPLGRPSEFASTTTRWRGWAEEAAADIDGLSIRIDCCDYDLIWERIAFQGDTVEAQRDYPLPLYPRAYSLYVDACLDIERLAGRAQDIFAALSDLSDEVSLVDEYDELFPEYADLDYDAYLDDPDAWDADDHALDKERALDELDYGGWWLTWKDGSDSNIEKLQSGKVLIGILGQLCNAGLMDSIQPPPSDWLLTWIRDFVGRVDKHGLWHADDDVNSIRLAVAWCEESGMRSRL